MFELELSDFQQDPPLFQIAISQKSAGPPKKNLGMHAYTSSRTVKTSRCIKATITVGCLNSFCSVSIRRILVEVGCHAVVDSLLLLRIGNNENIEGGY